jgi:hypothetical protein
MLINTKNYSAFLNSNSEGSSISNIVSNNSINIIDGCNEALRNNNYSRLIFLIPNIYIENVCNTVNRSLTEILDEFRLFTFNYIVHTSKSHAEYIFVDGESHKVSESTLFELNINHYINDKINYSYSERMKYRYYGFCLLRHFYYYQNVLDQYYKMYDENDSIAHKMIKLSVSVHKCDINYNMHTFIPRYFNDLKADIKNVLSTYCSNNNSGIKYRFVKNVDLFEPDYNSYISNYNNYLRGLNDNFILVSNFEFSSLPEEIRNTKLNSYLVRNIYFTGISHDYYNILNINDDQLQFFDKNNELIYNMRDIIEVRDLDEDTLVYNLKTENNTYNTIYYIKDKIFKFNAVRYEEFLNSQGIFKNNKRYIVKIRSRHPSHSVFRNRLKSNKKVLIRLGSITETPYNYDLVINTPEAIKISSNKYKMKEAFDVAGVITPEWTYNIDDLLGNEPVFSYPIVAKNVYGSRGTGNYKINSPEDLITWSRNRNLKNYIFEKFKNYGKEYRVHVSKEGVFLMWRKLRRLDTPDDQKWFFNNRNCNWVGENHELFDTPSNINQIKEECIKALNAVGLDIGACDVRVMNNVNSRVHFSIIEINSAPSISPVTEEAYIKEFNKLINRT